MNRLVLASLALLLTSGSASAQSVRYNFDTQADFSTFHTYRWVSLAGGSKVNDLTGKQIVAAIDAELASKGLTKAPGDTADLYVTYQAAVDTEKQFTSYNTGMDWGYGPGWYRGGWYSSGMTTVGETTTIYVGQLALDIYDSAHHDLVWRGVASKSINPKAKPEKQAQNLGKAVAKMLENYPPKKK